MKTGALRIINLMLFLSAIGLAAFFPGAGYAGTVYVPGFTGSITAPPPVIQTPVLQPSISVNIPGFYGTSIVPPSPTALPQLKDGGMLQGAQVTSSQNQLTVQQNDKQAIIDWSNFNIGADSSVVFDQQKHTDWSALNRIWDMNPSLIFGKLSADGKIYLINQNGILFGQGSRVNVGSLTASALDIANEDFLNNILNFRLRNYMAGSDPAAQLDTLAVVSNYGEITAADNGNIFLVAPRVENAGMLNSPLGQIGLIAGTDVSFISPDLYDTSRSGFYIIVRDDFRNAPLNTDPSFGNSVNRQSGSMISDGGMVGMYGRNVDQWGVIRSTTAFRNRNGQVELRAADKVTTYAGSSITLPVNPSTTETVNDTFDIQPVVTIGGLHSLYADSGVRDNNPVTQIELGGLIQAPTGQVNIVAGSRVYLGETSVIDVSGVVADLPPDVLLDAKLTSVELRDYYAQKYGVLQGDRITTPVVSGSSIGDITQLILTQDKTALERSIGGAIRKVVDPINGDTRYIRQYGQVYIKASDDIIVKQGSIINLSGGALNYAGGALGVTKVISGNMIYDISNAPSSLHYDMVLGDYSKVYDRFGVIESYPGLYYGGASPLFTYVQGYTKGGDAGNLSLVAPSIVFDGKLIGGVVRGDYQNTWTQAASYTT